MAGQTPTTFISRMVWFQQSSSHFVDLKKEFFVFFFRGKSFTDVVTRRGNCFLVSVLEFRLFAF